MDSHRARFLGCRFLLAVELVLAALIPAGVASAGAGNHITVMTQNMFVGTGLGDAFTATSMSDLAAAGSHDWANLLATDFPTRAGVLADEIVQARPDVVALQEVSLWRDQTPGDVATHPEPDAGHVDFDYLAILLTALRARGLPYTAAVTSSGADLEFPRLASSGPVDLRLTDRDALLVRSDVADRVTNPLHGHYTAQLTDPFPTVPVRSTRSWTSIDYRSDAATTVRIFNTHLEVADPGTGTIQEQQAAELLGLIDASPYPVIALGDFNAAADGSATYRGLTAVLHDAWTAVRPSATGRTCCLSPSLADATGRMHTRIDLVLTTEDWPVAGMGRTGVRPFRTAPSPLWVSDHFGVTARLVIPPR